MKNNVIKLTKICKSFENNLVLKNINLELKSGRITGIVGKNGAGKSTLVNILAGNYILDKILGYTGEVFFNDKKIKLESINDSVRNGIIVLRQNSFLINDFRIYENIFLNREKTKKNIFSFLFRNKLDILETEKMILDCKTKLKKFNININSENKAKIFSESIIKFVEFVRELDREDISLLILDESTNVLSDRESNIFTEFIKYAANKNISIIFISHKLNEIKKICDEVFVLKNGEITKKFDKKNININKILECIDNDYKNIFKKNINNNKKLKINKTEDKKIVLKIKNLEINNKNNFNNKINLDILKNEIVGILNLEKDKKFLIANGIMRFNENVSGEIIYDDKKIDIKNKNIKEMLEIGFDVIEESNNLIIDKSIEINICFKAMQVSNRFLKKRFGILFIDNKKISEEARKYIELLKINCISEKQKVKELSNGNQRKVYIAQVLCNNPKVIFMCDLNVGIDRLSRENINKIMINYARKNNNSILIESSNIQELNNLCDRIIVLNKN
ncbi:MAG: ATP-binding cassette domain-containing protein [Clostridiales bacterium]|jgi:simple sugar transport system ATP-binding protein|nr:ATP-binding cassette domain-containing protein [Clostridiales bacterium]